MSVNDIVFGIFFALQDLYKARINYIILASKLDHYRILTTSSTDAYSYTLVYANLPRKVVRQMANNNNSKRGFAAMNPQKQREIAKEGGEAAHERGTAHEFDSQEAREAGKKGGQNSHSGGRNR